MEVGSETFFEAGEMDALVHAEAEDEAVDGELLGREY